MSVIRTGEAGYKAYIFIEAGSNQVHISTPSYNGLVNLGQAVKILNLLVKLDEVPHDIHDRLYSEIEKIMDLQNSANNTLTIENETLRQAAKKKK